ncbi:translocation/assembly module TamB domain-containing protein [Cribrihabitans pelagius]|uniref:translocation/assembly module TamB domain-containing protein n=1 Tax=Cribrihabitans pelagius TaxID=1765746 RepID=UPI003B5C7792
MRQFLAFTLAAGLTLAPAAAQDSSGEDAGGLLVGLLESTLSGESRYIDVTGLEGALSSRATVERITVSDEEGVWLTIEDAELDWNRLALLRGRFSVNTLSAGRITVARAPKPLPEDPELPAPEAEPFALPELPVSIELGEIKAERVDLGEPLFGTAASLSAEGSLSLADGALDTQLEVVRLDRPGDHLRLDAGYANETGVIDLDLSLQEDDGGLLSQMLNLPGGPDLQLAAKGSGPVTDFTANIDFKTDGETRLEGKVVLAAEDLPQDTAPGQQDAPDSDAPPRAIAFSADLGGNIDVLLAPASRPFFGPGLRLSVKGRRAGSGAVALDTLMLRTQALRVAGTAALDAAGALETASLSTQITPPEGADKVALPAGGGETTITGADLKLEKSAEGNWRLDGLLSGLSHPEAQVAEAEITGRGTLDQSTGLALEGRLTAALTGFEPRDPALAAATGNQIRFDGLISTTGAEAVRISGMELSGTGYRAGGDLAIEGLEEGLRLSGALTASLSDLARFSQLAGRPLGGTAEAEVKGFFTPLSGAFDAELAMQAQDLSAGIAQADELLQGTTTLALSAARGETGLLIRRFQLDGEALEAAATGTLSSETGDITASAALKRLEVFLPQAPGRLALETTLTRTGDQFSGVATLTGPHSSRAELDGMVTLAGDADFTFDAAFEELERFVPQLAGQLAAEGRAARRAGEWQFTAAAKGPAGFDGEAEGRFAEADGSAELSFDAEIARLQQLMPDLPGRLSAKGTASRDAGIWRFDADAAGPAGIDARLAGSWNEAEAVADATARGRLRLEGLNPFISPNLLAGPANFDLALKGPPALGSLSGALSTENASLAIPAAAQRLEDIDATVTLGSSTARVQLAARPRAGGALRISGPVALQPPFDGNLEIAIDDVVLTDNLSYESLLNGRLTLSGALASNRSLSGRIDVGETNINLNTAGGTVSAAPIPPIRHVGAPADVRRTLARAGLTGNGDGTGGTSRTALDVTISAPRRIFARGRGLRAELGGEIRLRGTAAQPAPAGQIELIRGTFDILGKRLELDEGRLTLLGDLKPYIAFRSTAATEEGTATLEISGRIDSPEIKVTSEPPRPSEEALALLLFGGNLEEISPLALARIAGTAYTLSGRGGGTRAQVRDATGADTVDIGVDNLGSGQLGLGGYVAENAYTDFNVNTRGDSELSINLDVTGSVTVKGTVDSEGETGIGLFFKRDY